MTRARFPKEKSSYKYDIGQYTYNHCDDGQGQISSHPMSHPMSYFPFHLYNVYDTANMDNHLIDYVYRLLCIFICEQFSLTVAKDIISSHVAF